MAKIALSYVISLVNGPPFIFREWLTPPPFPNSLAPLPSPKSGWNRVWQSLVDAGILTLPDAAEVNCNPRVFDGISYVVESNINMTYRTYMYGNPWYAKPPEYKRCDEARRMILIGKIIGEEFGLERFDLSEVLAQ
jgi:hypothetical protein